MLNMTLQRKHPESGSPPKMDIIDGFGIAKNGSVQIFNPKSLRNLEKLDFLDFPCINRLLKI